MCGRFDTSGLLWSEIHAQLWIPNGDDDRNWGHLDRSEAMQFLLGYRAATCPS
jgi:hypothetical protein